MKTTIRNQLTPVRRPMMKKENRDQALAIKKIGPFSQWNIIQPLRERDPIPVNKIDRPGDHSVKRN